MGDAGTQQGWVPSDPAYRRITLALFLAGFATFAMVYAPQPLLPVLRAGFGIDPGTATLALSVTTVALGIALLFFGPLSDAVGRTRLMNASILASALVCLAVAFSGSWSQLIVLRGLIGFALAGLPAVAAAYLREEIHPDHAGAATGLYVGGTALGSMAGRLVTGALADLFDWRIAMGGVGVLAFVTAIAVGLLLPPSRRFAPVELHHRELWATFRRMTADRGLLTLYGVGFATMGAFVACFNGMAFRLAAPPYALSVGVAGLIFLTYALGSLSSPLAGRRAARLGSRRVVPAALVVFGAGVAVTWFQPLPLVVLGTALISIGFFAAHGTTNGWVTARASRIGRGTGMAGSLYLSAYYLGSSVCGVLSGLAWSWGGWQAVMGLVGALLTIALGLTLSMCTIVALVGPDAPAPDPREPPLP